MKISKFEKFVENVSNLAKIRKWDTYDFSNRRKKDQRDTSDLYFTYNLKKDELGKYLNTWFTGVVSKSKDESKIYRDEMITLKKVDKETATHLYDRDYNPISINIMCPTGAKFKQDENGNDLYIMKAQLHSIDDSSYGIWWDDQYGTGYPLDKLMEIREQLMKWINAHPIINGEKFFDICVSLGAVEETKDYN
jgi:hypothetical protein